MLYSAGPRWTTTYPSTIGEVAACVHSGPMPFRGEPILPGQRFCGFGGYGGRVAGCLCLGWGGFGTCRCQQAMLHAISPQDPQFPFACAELMR